MFSRQRIKRLSLRFLWLFFKFVFYVVLGPFLLVALVLIGITVYTTIVPTDWIEDQLNRMNEEELEALRALGVPRTLE